MCRAAGQLLVRIHALSPVAAEAWVGSQPAVSPELAEQLGVHLTAARQRLLRPAGMADKNALGQTLPLGGGSRPGTSSSRGGSGGLGSTSRPTTAVTLGNLLQRPPTAMNGGAGLSLPPSFGGVRNALDREGLGARDAGGGGSHGEEPQILRLD